jgi:hypothetical protein
MPMRTGIDAQRFRAKNLCLEVKKRRSQTCETANPIQEQSLGTAR